jgi:hypothetical protein
VLADPLYVGYRSYRPDEKTVEGVKQKLQENYIDVSQLVKWPVVTARRNRLNRGRKFKIEKLA